MAAAFVVSMLLGAAIGFPFLQWGLRRDRAALARFERHAMRLLWPLLAAMMGLLFFLYTPRHATMLLALAVVTAARASRRLERRALPRAALAALLVAIFWTEIALAGCGD
jgi:hypothetical protein